MLLKTKERLAGIMRLLAVLLTCLFCFLGSLSPAAAAPEGSGRKIRVGYYGYKNLLSVDGNGNYSGYIHSYLTDIARHTGWQHEFVYSSLKDCLERLESGEIDLMVSLQKTPEREKKFSFSKNYVAMIYGMLCVNKEQGDVYYEDFEKFDGMRVGVLRGSNIRPNLLVYARANNFRVEPVDFDNSSQMFEALRGGRVDAVASSSLATIEGARVVAKFMPQPGHFVVRRGNEELLAELDEACSRLLAENFQYRELLLNKYYADSTLWQLTLTRREAEFLKTQRELTVAYDPNYHPVIYYDDEAKQVKGIAAAYLKHIAALTGLRFNFVRAENEQTMKAAAVAGTIDIVCAFDQYMGDGLGYNMSVSKPYCDLPLSYAGISGKAQKTSGFKTAVVRNRIGFWHDLRQAFPEASLAYHASLEDALEAVRKGEADYVLDNMYSLQSYLRQPGNESLSLLPYAGGSQVLSFGVSLKHDSRLLNIFNKVINSTSPDVRSRLMISNIAQAPYHLTFGMFLKRYLYQLISFLLLMLAALTAYFWFLEKRKQKALAEIAYYDQVTKIRNIEKFKLDADELITGGKYVVVVFDINHFRTVTATFGHNEGRRVLRLLSKKLNGVLGRDEMLAHASNDIFLLLLHDAADSELRQRLLGMQQMLRREIGRSGSLYKFSLAFGVYRLAPEERNMEGIIDLADIARLEAKNGRGGGVVFYKSDLGEKVLREAEIIGKTEKAFQNKEFTVFYQPKFALVSQKPAGAEALVRWQATEGMIMPGEFIDIFERSGFIQKLDLYVFEQVCADLRRLLDEGRRALPVSVNISRLHLLDSDFVKDYGRIIEKYGVPPALLELEITENMPIDSEDFLVEVFNSLADLGVTLAVDDFGSGYSSLNVLHDMPFNTLKIDRLFFQDKTRSSKGRRIIETIVIMAQKLGMAVVAEGVESREQADFLQAIGCDFVQGYYFAMPLSAKEYEALL